MKHRPAKEDDMPFILTALADIHEGQKSEMNLEGEAFLARLKRDLFSSDPRAFVSVVDVDGEAAAMVMYSFAYFAAEGRILWVSQAYIEPAQRGRITGYFRDHILDIARSNDAGHIVFGSDIKKTKLHRLWEYSGGENLNKFFSFWAIEVKEK